MKIRVRATWATTRAKWKWSQWHRWDSHTASRLQGMTLHTRTSIWTRTIWRRTQAPTQPSKMEHLNLPLSHRAVLKESNLAHNNGHLTLSARTISHKCKKRTLWLNQAASVLLRKIWRTILSANQVLRCSGLTSRKLMSTMKLACRTRASQWFKKRFTTSTTSQKTWRRVSSRMRRRPRIASRPAISKALTTWILLASLKRAHKSINCKTLKALFLARSLAIKMSRTKEVWVLALTRSLPPSKLLQRRSITLASSWVAKILIVVQR